MLSMHQLPMLDSLGAIQDCSVRLVCPLEIESNRVGEGWELSPTRNIEILPLDRGSMRWLDDNFGRDCWHIFSGFGVYPVLRAPFYSAMRKGRRVAAMTERPTETDPLRDAMRSIRYRWHALRWKAHIQRIVAMGEAAADYYTRIGFPRGAVFEFGYFPAINVPPTQREPDKIHDAPFEILVVAGHQPWKRIDLALHAAAAQERECHLTVVGTGPLSGKLKSLAETLPFRHRVTWIDRLPNGEVRRRMAEADLLVLPSSYDGWGAVINEALGAGTPAICSSACGAKALAKYGLPLRVFQNGDLDGLGLAIAAQLARGKLKPEDRQRIRELAEAIISPRAAAQVLWREFTR